MGKIQWESLDWLSEWKDKYYPVVNGMIKGRAVYPVIFKKICFFWLVEAKIIKKKNEVSQMSDSYLIEQVGLEDNILNKWHISPRYRKKANRDSYSSITLYRNGKKQSYLISAIKRAYYESGRQRAEADLLIKWMAPKMNPLEKFVDVFAGTGTVVASVEANESVVNDIDVGVACFLYSMSHDSNEVRERLAQLHNNFVSKDLSEGQNLYTVKEWQKHKKHYEKYIDIPLFEDIIIRMRNNYVYIHEQYVKATTGVTLNFTNASGKDIQMYYDIGVAWMFLNSFKQKNQRGNQFNVIDMDIPAYEKYLRNVLMIAYKSDKKYKKYHQVDASDATFLEKLRIKKSQIKFIDGIDYMKSLKNAGVRCEDFRDIIKENSDGFIYLDSPYFLTTDYEVPFRDEEHKQMLDMLRNSDFNWLFSMQYIKWSKETPNSGVRKRQAYQEEGHPLIRSYWSYYHGFVRPFEIVLEKKKQYYKVDTKKEIKAEKTIWLLLFYYTYQYRGATGDIIIHISNDKLATILMPVPPLEEQHRIVAKIEEILPYIEQYDKAYTKLETFNKKFPEDMKKSILQLAMQGKLVEQRPEEGTADEQCEQIVAEKAQLIKDGKIKKEKPLPEITEDEIPFEIPASWKWVRLSAICEKIGSGSTPTGGKNVYQDDGILFLRSQNVYNDGLRFDGIAFISEELNRPNSVVVAKDILLNITGGSIGRCALVPDDFDKANINQHVMIIRLVNLDLRFWVHFVIISAYIQQKIMDVQVGVSREGLSAEKLKNFIIPLPPLAEQKRIVAKIEELLPYCDQLIKC